MRAVLALFQGIVLFLSASALAQSEPAATKSQILLLPSLSFMPPHDAIDQAISEELGVLRARAMLKSAEAQARAREVGPHEFTLHGEYLSRATNLEGRLNEWTAGISRGIRLPGKSEADSKIGAFGIAVAENGFGDARHQAATLLKTLWLDWVVSETIAMLADNEAAGYEKQLKATQRSQQLGQSATFQVEQVQASLALAQALAAQAAQARLDARMTLQRTFPTLVLSAVPAMPEPVPPPGSWDEWRASVLDDNHELKMARSEADRRDWLARRASMDRFADPTLDLRTFQERGGHETGFGIGFSIPIGGALRSATADQASAEASAAAVTARKALRDVEIVADRDVIQARQGLAAWRQSLAAAKASGQMLVRMQRAVALGDQALTDLLIAQRQDFDIRRTELRGRAAAHGAILQLMIDAHRIWSLGDE